MVVLVVVNRFLVAERRRLAVTLGVLALATGVLSAHGLLGGDHMGPAAAACVAVMESAALAAGVAIAARLQGATQLARPVESVVIRAIRPRRPPEPRARAGPSVLQVFRR